MNDWLTSEGLINTFVLHLDIDDDAVLTVTRCELDANGRIQFDPATEDVVTGKFDVMKRVDRFRPRNLPPTGVFV